jgi:hypothetical protein
MSEMPPTTRTIVSIIGVVGASLSVGWLLTVVRPEHRALLLLLVGGLAGISAASAVMNMPAARSPQPWLRLVSWLLVVLLAAFLVPQRAPMPGPSLATVLLVVIAAACIGCGAGVAVRVARRYGAA